LKQAAARLAQMGIGVAVLTETKFVDDRYPKTAAGYRIMSSKAVSCSQGGVALAWREDNLKFKVELVLFHGPNTLTFQLTTRDEQIYVIGTNIPPNCTRGVEDIHRALEACPVGCKLLIMGDLNINVGFPSDEREEVIVDLLNELGLVDSSRGYWLQTPRWTTTRARWTWSQKRGKTRHYSQPDYVLAQAEETGMFTGMGFRFPCFLQSDHRAIVAVVRAGGEGRLKKYRRKRQKLPLSLPLGPKDADTTAFDTLAAECVNLKQTRKQGKDWMTEGTWRLIAKRGSLMQSGCIPQDAAQRMRHEIKAAIKADKRKLTAKVGNWIVAELAKGEVKEALWHLKGWYRKATEMQARPYRQTMEHQTNKQEELYAERAAYGKAFPANGMPYTIGNIGNNQPCESKLGAVVSLLSHGQCGGTSGIQAEHIKAWLRGAKKEEDPETAASHVGAGKTWQEFVRLYSSVWNTGTIPQQMCWVITVLIPKGGGEYRGIGLLEPIWKVLEKVMDLRLEAIMLHNSLHGCLVLQGMGTGIIEAKLAQQLAHLERTPLFGIFIDLQKAFDAMDCSRCLEILALHGVGPKLLHLICNFWDLATNVCWEKGNYGRPFKAGRSVTQGGPLSAKLFNIVVNAVVWEWMQLMHATIDDADGNLAKCITGLFAVFYINDGYIASRKAEFLQEALDILVKTFKQVGLATNMKKTQAMICTPGKIRVQLPMDSY
jgi:hypothetical protein